jgi:hypothetical protein
MSGSGMVHPMTDVDAKQTPGALLSGRLDFGWWASNGPTAGYLVSLVLESVSRLPGLGSVTPRSVDLRVVRLPAADDFEVTAAFAEAAGGVATVVVTLAQREPFATASVQLGRRLAEESIAPSHRPSAFPPEVFAEMKIRPGLPPVTCQFTYRPTTNPDGTSPQPGWDLVWVSPRSVPFSGHEHTAKILDCWYPASYTRAVREHLSRARPPSELSQPSATNLLGAHVEFTSPDEAYADLSHALLASRLKSSADGYQFEEQEIWSDRGDLLVDAQIVRRQERPQVAHSGTDTPEPAISEASST